MKEFDLLKQLKSTQSKRYFFITVRYHNRNWDIIFKNLIIPTNGRHFNIQDCKKALIEDLEQPNRCCVTFYNEISKSDATNFYTQLKPLQHEFTSTEEKKRHTN